MVVSSLPTLLLTIILLIMSVINKRYPSKYGSHTGYNTIISRKSEEIWDYAQQLAGIYAFRFSCISLIVSILWVLICVILKNNELGKISDYIIINLCMVVCLIVFLFAQIEMKLKHYQGKEG